MSTDRPDVHAPLTGGCLCGTLRYTITFPPGSAYPPFVAHPRSYLPTTPAANRPLSQRLTCQCTQCRKTSGSMLAHALAIPPAQLEWAPVAKSTMKEYQSSPTVKRSFCGECGATLTYSNTVSRLPRVIVFAGSLDEGVVTRCPELVTEAEAHFFCGNAIEGVTDRLRGGVRWLEMHGGEKW